jgi:hypothetical protein
MGGVVSRAPSTPRARAGAVALAVALAVVAVGCSKGSSPSQGQYVAQADSVCQAQDEKMDDLQVRYDESRYQAAVTGEESANVARPERWMRAEIVPEYEAMSGMLKGMRAPSGDSDYLGDLYSDLDRLITDLNSRPSQGRELISEDAELRNRFASYGMEICGTV